VSFKVQEWVICPVVEYLPSIMIRSSSFSFRSSFRFKNKAKSRSIIWEVALQSIIQVPGRELLIVVLKVIGDSEPRSLEREIEDKRNATEIRYLHSLLL